MSKGLSDELKYKCKIFSNIGRNLDKQAFIKVWTI